MEGHAFICKSRTFMFMCGLTASHTLPWFHLVQVNFTCTGKEKFSDFGIQALDTNMKMQRKLFILTGFFCAVSGKIDVDMADFTLR